MKTLKHIFLIFILIFLSLIITSCNQDEKVYQFIEESIVVETGDYKMPGILALPITDKKVPAVVFVHGSGAIDMNGSVGALQLFKDLATQLAKKGIASIRYDKRTYTYAQELSVKLDFTIYDEVIDDAVSAIDLLQSNEKIGDIYIVGHSFGGQLASVIANKTNVKGVIILAGTTEHIIDLMMKQLKEQNSPYYNIYDPYDEYFRNIQEVVPLEIGYFFMGAYETYWVSYNNIDVIKEIQICSENKKMLILQGGLDLQVKADEINSFKNIVNNKNVLFKLYDNLNHMFVDGKGETLSSAYTSYKTIPLEVINDIVDFINKE